MLPFATKTSCEHSQMGKLLWWVLFFKGKAYNSIGHHYTNPKSAYMVATME
jgi:hypothetical protein